MAAYSLSFKLFIDSKNHKVLLAEAGKDVVDFLFSILTLPVGTVTKLLKGQGMVGTLGNLYKSIEDLNDTYMLPSPVPNNNNNNNNKKDALLKPRFAIRTSTANVPPLLLSNVPNNVLYRCSQCRVHVSDDQQAICPRCRCNIGSQAPGFAFGSSNSASGDVDGGFVKGEVAYMIMDDLEVKPLSTVSITSLLNEFDVKDVSVIQEKEINLSMDEGLKMLKASFMTQTVLTYVFLGGEESRDYAT